MTAKEVLTALGNLDALEDVQTYWSESMAAMPAGIPEYLDPSQWRASARCSGLDVSLDAVLERCAARITSDPALLRLNWHGYWRIFHCPTAAPLANWPYLTSVLGDDAGVFYLLIGLGFVPLMRRHHQRLGIPESITVETAQQARCYCYDTYAPVNAGLPGLHLGQLSWLRHYTRERYVRLGRLEFWLGPNPHGIRVYRHTQSKRVIALAAPGTHFAPDGSIHRDAADNPPNDGWDAIFEERDDRVTGTLVRPDGRGTREQVVLPRDSWECVLQKGDTVLMLHIPSGGGMTPEACQESFRRAAAFFPTHFPAEPPRAIVCASWIFSNQLQEIFAPDANLVRFQRELYLFPVPSGPWDGLWFVFLIRGELDPTTAPRQTSLQRGILDYLAKGNRWHVGGMFFLLDDIARYGEQVYVCEQDDLLA